MYNLENWRVGNSQTEKELIDKYLVFPHSSDSSEFLLRFVGHPSRIEPLLATVTLILALYCIRCPFSLSPDLLLISGITSKYTTRIRVFFQNTWQGKPTCESDANPSP